jgi:hypothetical protein
MPFDDISFLQNLHGVVSLGEAVIIVTGAVEVEVVVGAGCELMCLDRNRLRCWLVLRKHTDRCFSSSRLCSLSRQASYSIEIEL